MYIAFDDTDSTNFMCTTFLATEIIRALPQYDLIGFPRLVRLNPSVPWKTRGNGALCLRLGHGAGQSSIIGEIEGREIKSYSRSKGAPDRDEVLELCHQLLTQWSRTQEDASPGMVVSERQPSQRLYWRTVREIVRKEEVLEELHRVGASFFELAGGRGIIGASAAMSWRPRDRTYEILAYRTRERWGSPREVRPEDVALLDSLYPSTFNNYDSVAQRPVIVPHSPCPILFGIRGDDPSVLPSAMRSIRGEAIDRWLIFITNQGTDDHIIRKWSELRPWSSYCVQGKVSKAPHTIAGGHVILGLSTKVGEVECAAYEPSKEFREVVRKLIAGDEVVVMGELRENPRTLNLEKLCVTELARDWRKVSNPICPQCSKSMKSMGVGGWYRCKCCGQKSKGGEKREEMPRDLVPGWYEPPVRARRHLSMPLKRQLHL